MTDVSAHSGLDLLRMMLAGKFGMPSMAKTLNFTLVEANHGEAVFRGTPTRDHMNPMGQVHGGWPGTILDSAMGCAVHSVLKPGQIYSTLEFKVNITRSIPPGTEVETRGHVQHSGRSTAVASGEIRGVEDGRLYGTGSTTCIIMDMPKDLTAAAVSTG